MKMRIPPVIVLFVLLPSFLISSDTTIADHLIFPNPAEKICFVTATGKSGKLLVGKKLPADHALVEKIAEQMNFPFHRSVIKLSQCTRNLSSDTKGPNVLFLSQDFTSLRCRHEPPFKEDLAHTFRGKQIFRIFCHFSSHFLRFKLLIYYFIIISHSIKAFFLLW